MEEGGAGQAQDGADEEKEEDQLVRDIDVVVAVGAERLHVEHDGDDDKSDEPDQVGTDVSGIRVDAEDGAEALSERIELRTVAEMQKVIISGNIENIFVNT